MPQNSRPRQTVARPMRPSPVLSLNLCIADYLADCRARNLSESTIAHYARAMQLLAECMPSGDVWHSTHGVRTAGAPAASRPQYGKSSLSMYLRAWRSFLGFCHVEEFTSENLGKVIKRRRQNRVATSSSMRRRCGNCSTRYVWTIAASVIYLRCFTWSVGDEAMAHLRLNTVELAAKGRNSALSACNLCQELHLFRSLQRSDAFL
jgi:hypothetical protein